MKSSRQSVVVKHDFLLPAAFHIGLIPFHTGLYFKIEWARVTANKSQFKKPKTKHWTTKRIKKRLDLIYIKEAKK